MNRTTITIVLLLIAGVSIAQQTPSVIVRSPDLNGDGMVGGADLGIMLGAWGTFIEPVVQPPPVYARPTILLRTKGARDAFDPLTDVVLASALSVSHMRVVELGHNVVLPTGEIAFFWWYFTKVNIYNERFFVHDHPADIYARLDNNGWDASTDITAYWPSRAQWNVPIRDNLDSIVTLTAAQRMGARVLALQHFAQVRTP